MLRLNDDSIFVGQIKQLLKNFNLPDCYIGTDNIPSKHIYIDNSSDMICYLDNNGYSKQMQPYLFNHKYLNFTKNLKIENLLYDRTTHRYLGEYLRFLRKVQSLDLMSMFNCFDQETIDLNQQYLRSKIKAFDEDEKYNSHFMDKNYTCYRIPITKLSSKEYSIYFQSTLSLEFMIYVDNYIFINKEDQQTIHSKELIKSSYRKISTSKGFLLDLKDFFNITKLNKKSSNDSSEEINTIPYTKEDAIYLKEALQDDSNIYLLVNIPRGLKSSLTILDGNYIDNKQIENNVTYTEDDDISKLKGVNLNFCTFGYNINPQLVSYENNSNYLLSDKLVQYLTENAITPSSMDYDIKKVQKYLFNFYRDKILNNQANKLKELYTDIPGYWSDIDTVAMKQLLLEYLINNSGKNLYDFKDNQFYYDRLPFVDTDLESLMKNYITSYELDSLKGDN